MTANTYIMRLLLCTAIVITVVLGVNYTIDPYGITGATRMAGFNQYKVDINDFTRLNKKYQPLAREHNALVLGNSRVEMGVDPAHSCFVADDLQVYNLGMPGADVRTQINYALNVMYQQPIRQIFLSVDFIDFISTDLNPQVPTPLLDQTTGQLQYLPSGEPNPDYFETKAMDYYKSLFSLDALVSSFKTVVGQNPLAPDRDEAGFNPAQDFQAMVQIEGPRALFDQKMQNLRKKYSERWYLRDANGALGPVFEDLTGFLKIAEQRDVTVYFFTHPFHDSYWALMDEQGLIPLYEDWKRSIVELAQNANRPANQFWDFSEDSSYIHEPVPDVGAKTGPLQWFWEPAHYRAQLGEVMVDAMMSETCGGDVTFGRRIF
ncbi:MAG: hypothetical protein ACI9JM_000020 [Halioglobus sp.]|jgi:hypothetical protein